MTKDIILHEILIPSLQELYKVDYDNIRFGASERNICARLAYHIENKMRWYDMNNNVNDFRHYYADVEYDRMGNGDRKCYENSEHLPQPMISDLLIQSRGENPNYLAVEMKRKKSYNKRREDRDRLKALVSSEPVRKELPCVYGTLVGAFIIYSPDDIKIEVYENVGTHGDNTGVIKMRYDEVQRELVMSENIRR